MHQQHQVRKNASLAAVVQPKKPGIFVIFFHHISLEHIFFNPRIVSLAKTAVFPPDFRFLRS